MIYLGPIGVPTISRDSTSAADDLIRLGLNAWEVNFTHGVKMSLETAKRIGEESKKLLLSIHAPYYINFCNPEQIANSRRQILESVERAKVMDAKMVGFHAGYYGDLDKEEASKMILNACQEMGKNLGDVKLALETTGKHSQWGTLEEIIELCKKLRSCTPLVDFAHIYARSNGKIDYAEVFDKLKILKLKHLHCHFSNLTYTAKGERYHIPIDHNPDFLPLAKEILKRKLDITIISESPILEQDALKMKHIFEKLGYKF